MEQSLNYIKIRKREFQLEVGDRFYTNGRIFTYYPSTQENKEKVPYQGWDVKVPKIEVTKKYYEAIKNASNFSTLKNTITEHRRENGDVFYRGEAWYQVEEVSRIVIEKEDLGELLYIGVGINGSLKTDRTELFNYKSVPIKEINTKTIILEKDLSYRTHWNKDILMKIHNRAIYSSDYVMDSDLYCIICYFDDIDEAKDILLEKIKESVKNKLEQALEDYNNLNVLISKSGYFEENDLEIIEKQNKTI